MGEFLNKYAGRNRSTTPQDLEELARVFRETIDVFNSTLDSRPFRLTSTLNVAVFDSCMVGMATRLLANKNTPPDPAKVRERYSALLKEPDYVEAVSRSTADDAFVQTRTKKAIAYFSEC